MTAFNCVRMRVKPGREQDYLDAHRNMPDPGWPGMRHACIIKTGERTYCVIGEDALVKARPSMVATLDRIRPFLEDLGGDLGLTDPVSGDVVVQMK
jgi:hypothetical protein